MQRNGTPSDVDFTKALIRKFMRLSNGSVVVLYNTSLDYEDDWSPERRSNDRLWLCIFIGVFLSVCAVISLLVLLYVFCTQRSSLWPFYRAGTRTVEQPGDDKFIQSPEVAEEGRAGPPPEQEDLLMGTQTQTPATLPDSSSSESETEVRRQKEP